MVPPPTLLYPPLSRVAIRARALRAAEAPQGRGAAFLCRPPAGPLWLGDSRLLPSALVSVPVSVSVSVSARAPPTPAFPVPVLSGGWYTTSHRGQRRRRRAALPV